MADLLVLGVDLQVLLVQAVLLLVLQGLVVAVAEEEAAEVAAAAEHLQAPQERQQGLAVRTTMAFLINQEVNCLPLMRPRVTFPADQVDLKKRRLRNAPKETLTLDQPLLISVAPSLSPLTSKPNSHLYTCRSMKRRGQQLDTSEFYNILRLK